LCVQISNGHTKITVNQVKVVY